MTSDKKIIVKAKFAPKTRTMVLDEKGKRIGAVFDVFGPIFSPYVKINAKEPENLINKIVYVSPFHKKNKRNRRK
jgi:rRNA processing protein Gar1